MSNFSDEVEKDVVNATLRNIAYPLPAAHYVALFTAAPGEGNSPSNEAAYTGYARKDAAAGGALGSGFSAPSNGVTSNLNELVFGANADAGSVTITHMAIVDSASGACNVLYWAALTASKTLQQNDKIVFAAGSIQITVD